MRIIPFVVPASVILLLASCTRQPAFKPVASVKQLMEGTVHPASEVVFEAVGTVISASGVEEIAPKNDEEWEDVQNNALMLAECGNLFMKGEGTMNKGDWLKMSQALIDAGAIAYKAAAENTSDALS